MRAVYDEDEELDFSLLRQSVRQQPRGAAAGRQTEYRYSGQQRSVNVEHWQTRGSQNKVRQVGIYPGQTSARRPQTMQEKQRQRQAMLQARRKRRLRRQKQLLAVLLCILLGGTTFALYRQKRVGTESETGGQTVQQIQAEREPTAMRGELGVIQGIPESQFNLHPDWTEDFLTISEYSRPGDSLGEVKNIFVHYTANKKTSAAQNRSYFENLKDTHDVRGASAHFIIGIEGEILQIVPLDEMAYAVQTRNEDSISIECCYKYDNGQFTQETYDSLIKLLAWLVDTYELEADDILRHYDCGGKKCPLYYVENEDAWRILKRDVENARSSLSK